MSRRGCEGTRWFLHTRVEMACMCSRSLNPHSFMFMNPERSPKLISGSFHSAPHSPPPNPVFPDVPTFNFNSNPGPNTDPRRSPPVAVPMVIPPPSLSTTPAFQDAKLVLRSRSAVVYCPSCQRNISTNLRGRRLTL